MKTIVATPGPALLESMRSVGYTVEAAVADVIDNSVAAQANEVEILVSSHGAFQMAIVDDGYGMTREGAIHAMTLAATSPTAHRSPEDLGRFGLGLKTASLSQCRVLTIVTKQQGVVTALRWSLDYVLKTGDWSLIELEKHEIDELLGWRILAQRRSGTLVHWGDLDQLKIAEGERQDDLDHVAQRIRKHVALVFHLFNGTEKYRQIEFKMNGAKIDPIDPFMSHSRLTTRSAWESMVVEGQEVRLMAYTLPYLNKLSQTERNRALLLGGLRETQGFYVYRGGRLVIWGNWFRVMPRSEMAKLTRVRVEIPNSLDHLWSLDVKKSHAAPPPLVRKRLSELARTMMTPSQRVQEFRGRKVIEPTGFDPMWTPLVNGDEFSYEINSTHQAVSSFVGTLSDDQQKQFGLLLEDLQNTFPIIDAHNRMSADAVPTAPDDESILERALSGWLIAESMGMSFETFAATTSNSDPYCLIENFTSRLREAAQK